MYECRSHGRLGTTHGVLAVSSACWIGLRCRVYEDDPVAYVQCARGPCMLFVCLVHVRAWRCVRCIGLDLLIVYHRVVWHIILILCFTMCALFFFLRFDGFGVVHRETLAKRLYLKIAWRVGSLRFGMCVFVHFLVGCVSVIVE